MYKKSKFRVLFVEDYKQTQWMKAESGEEEFYFIDEEKQANKDEEQANEEEANKGEEKVQEGEKVPPRQLHTTIKDKMRATVIDHVNITLCAAMGSEGLVHRHAILESYKSPLSSHFPRGAMRHPPGPPTTPSWAHTTHSCDHLGQCPLPLKSESGSSPTVTTC